MLSAVLTTTHLQRIGAPAQSLLQEIERSVPFVVAVVFYGSRLTDTADVLSDLDVWVIAKGVPDFGEQVALEERLTSLAGSRVHLVMGSPRAMTVRLRTEPYLRHILETGLIVGDTSFLPSPLPPLAKEGAQGCAISLRLDLEMMLDASSSAEADLRWHAEILFATLKQLFIVRHAINGEFRLMLRSLLLGAIGADLYRRLREPEGEMRLEDIELLLSKTRALLAEVQEACNHMQLNESDEFLRRWVQERREQKRRATQSSN